MAPFDMLLYAGVVFGWSTSWLPLKWQLGVVAPEISLFWRFLMAALPLSPMQRWWFILISSLQEPHNETYHSRNGNR